MLPQLKNAIEQLNMETINNKHYEPYGPEWKKEISKMTKSEIIDIMSALGKNTNIKYEKLNHEIVQLRKALSEAQSGILSSQTMQDLKRQLEEVKAAKDEIQKESDWNLMLLPECWMAARDWQIGEHAEWNGGKENERPNFTEWLMKMGDRKRQEAAPQQKGGDQ